LTEHDHLWGDIDQVFASHDVRDLQIKIVYGVSGKERCASITSTHHEILNVSIFKDNAATNNVFPGSCALIRDAKSDSSLIDVRQAICKPLFHGIVVQIGSFALADRLAVKINLEPLKRPVNVIDELGPREFSVCVLDPQNELASCMSRVEPVKESSSG